MADRKSVIDAFEKGLREKIFDRECVLLLVKDVANAVELLKEQQAEIEQLRNDANDDDDYDPCYECRGLGDDYIVNNDGELESWCDKCGVNPDRIKDDT